MDISQELALGIDIGGTNTKYGIVNHRGDILQKGDLRTDAYATVELFIEALHEKLKPVIETCEKDGVIRGIGIGAPNGNYYSGTIEYAPNLVWKGVIPLADLMAERFQPALLVNK